MQALKGHGTENDFVLLPDLDGAIQLTPALVRALCDRHAGLGADGVLRVVRSENDQFSKEFAAQAEFFMDYRNADGSIAEMCGNGLRVFMRYLNRVGLVEQNATVATRGGIMSVRSCTDGNISVQMGSPQVLADRPSVTVAQRAGRSSQPAVSSASADASAGAVLSLGAVLMPNPHVVVQIEAAELEALDLSSPPLVEPALPDGQNVEFVALVAPRHLRMRVHERGVGETRSCGTGICAAVAAYATADGSGTSGARWQVDVPGGTCWVCWHPHGGIELIGPAVIVAEVDVAEDWLADIAG